jgi:hypothetical protein
MASDSLSSALEAFVASNIETIAELEALILLRGNPQKAWRAADLAQRVYVSATDAELMLQRLEQRGFLGSDDGATFCYNSKSSKAPMVDQVVLAYRHSLIALTQLVHAKERNLAPR